MMLFQYKKYIVVSTVIAQLFGVWLLFARDMYLFRGLSYVACAALTTAGVIVLVVGAEGLERKVKELESEAAAAATTTAAATPVTPRTSTTETRRDSLPRQPPPYESVPNYGLAADPAETGGQCRNGATDDVESNPRPATGWVGRENFDDPRDHEGLDWRRPPHARLAR